MKLTYRGISYKFLNVENKSKPKVKAKTNTHQTLRIRPLHYYTYRGVSYTKHLTFDGNTNILLDIDRQ